MNHMIHIAAISQIRLETEGRAYYRRKRAEGVKPLDAIRCPKRRISDAIYRKPLTDTEQAAGTGPGGHCGASRELSAVDLPRKSTLRISHFPDPQRQRSNRPAPPERPQGGQPFHRPPDNKGEPG